MLSSTDADATAGPTRIKWTRLALSGDNYDCWDAYLYLAALGDYEWDLNPILNYCELLKPTLLPGTKPVPYEPFKKVDSTTEFRNRK
ncbi:hypothetical protein SARC_01575 [Sphaeroforma arctica JP610]|uniref:Uncharacterized protein n=1 Tax=Sphaeroforma arctica JP610 TaxID=667725 RepID=A0A0L0GDC9_9EUKA|nr:hypothetical protein SARC_01575 [Sphaeroforma arctica JP610]KNC86253.1 hypothetical protein SARC_01575 [Sphaeroforma arctica JP610]|eukprot:XP_014160155.1 hypothetical protein SARC_01575 [Sphaeroforma arctica JP610]